MADTDIAPKLIRQVKDAFAEKVENDRTVQGILAKIEDGTATYHDANIYAQHIGAHLQSALSQYVTSETLPDGKMYFNIAERLYSETFGEACSMSGDIAQQVQEILNRKASIGLKALGVDIPEDQIKSLADLASSYEQYDEIRSKIEGASSRYTQNTVVDTLRKNAELQSQAGLHPILTRIADPNCCPWCEEVAGTYDYTEVKQKGNPVWRRHDNCNCEIIYDPRDGRAKQMVPGKRR